MTSLSINANVLRADGPLQTRHPAMAGQFHQDALWATVAWKVGAPSFKMIALPSCVFFLGLGGIAAGAIQSLLSWMDMAGAEEALLNLLHQLFRTRAIHNLMD